MGNGTNHLVPDGGVRGLVVQLSSLAGLSGGETPPAPEPGARVEIAALAGTPLSRVINFAVKRGLSGLEFAAGIPGSVGGAVAMNAGAHGRSVGERVLWVDLLDPAGDEHRVPREEIAFAYRSTRFPREGFVVETGLEFAARGEPEVLLETKRCLEEHKRRLPFGWGSAGSVFKNPPGDAAGRLIEAAGLKGLRVGGAEVSAKHANVIVNVDQATAADILELMRLVVERVERVSGAKLEAEIRVVGEDGRSGARGEA
jgi:UDP-N-acetylmuramate dehydrogenase